MRSSMNRLCPTQAAGCCVAPGFGEPATRSRRVGARVLRRLFLFALLAGTVAAPGASARSKAPREAAPAVTADQGRVAEWKLFTAPDEAFSVRLPGEPRTTAQLAGATYLVRIGQYVTYVVFASSVGVFPIATSERVPPFEEILETTRDESLAPLREFCRANNPARLSAPCVSVVSRSEAWFGDRLCGLVPRNRLRRRCS